MQFSTTLKIGVLGGGQLGKMLCLAAANLDQKIYILDPSTDCPARSVCTGFTQGDFKDYDTVMAFGADKDILTIEIEHVNTRALSDLARMGKIVHPAPDALDTIKDKGLQKTFLETHGIPTSPFQLFEDKSAVLAAVDAGLAFPFVQKTRTAGYDGRGVAIIRSREDMASKLLEGACLVEAFVPFAAEIAVIAARNADDQTSVFPAVEMEFHPDANLVELLICPARISPLIAAEAEALAERVIEAFGNCGLLAVEMFLTTDGRLLVNEVAPRPHNSGHHTIDSAETNQYQQHLRAICNLPLGPVRQIRPAVMINLLGAPDHHGPVRYEGMEKALAEPGVYVHLYGKSTTSPFRKMGHITVCADTIEAAIERGRKVQKWVKVLA